LAGGSLDAVRFGASLAVIIRQRLAGDHNDASVFIHFDANNFDPGGHDGLYRLGDIGLFECIKFGKKIEVLTAPLRRQLGIA
jgi:hypothetical protein